MQLVPRQKQKLARPVRQLAAAATLAVVIVFTSGPRASCPAAFLLTSSFHSSSGRVPASTNRRAEAVPAATALAQPMSEANVFLTEVNQMTGELDVSSLPDAMGVYAIFDEEGKLQYIGLSKQISKSVDSHANSIGIEEAGSLIASVKCLEMPGETKETLKATWERWIKEYMAGGGEIPVGNLPESAPGADPRWRSKAASQAKAPLNLGGVRGITSFPEAMDAVKRAVTTHPVVLFMKGSPAAPQCGFSARSVGIMNSLGVPFETVNILDQESNPGVRDAVKQFSNWPTIPQLFVNGELIGGADIITEMHGSGQLEKKLKSVGGSSNAADDSGSQQSASEVPAGDILLINDRSRPTATQMSNALNKQFQLHTLRIVDNSAAHEGDAGALEMGLTGESHFSVEIVARDFDGLSPVQRQQKVYSALSEVMPRIHALSLVTRTPAEL